MSRNPASQGGPSWNTGGADLERLAAAVSGRFGEIGAADLVPLETGGLSHAHVGIRGGRRLLRVPRLSAYGFSPEDNLHYQAACFARAAPSAAVPALHGTVPPQTGVPWGALVVERIAGRPPRMPGDLHAIARSLAAIHRLPVPAKRQRPPILFHGDPVGATLEVIAAGSAFLDRAGIDPESRRQIEDEFRRARARAGAPVDSPHPVTLAGTDTHPGNFLVGREGAAVFVDLEKMVYGSPAIDLAHATVYTSTMWDADVAAALTAEETSRFHETYLAALPDGLGDRVRPWIGPMRRLTWLRTMTWFARWKVRSAGDAPGSAASPGAGLMEAIRRRFDDYFAPATIERIRRGFDDFG